MELLPAHFDLQGNASGTMPRSVLPLYPLIGAGVYIGKDAIFHVGRTDSPASRCCCVCFQPGKIPQKSVLDRRKGSRNNVPG